MKEVWVTGVVPATKPSMVKLEWLEEKGSELECERVLARVSVPSEVLGCWYIYALVSSS